MLRCLPLVFGSVLDGNFQDIGNGSGNVWEDVGWECDIRNGNMNGLLMIRHGFSPFFLAGVFWVQNQQIHLGNWEKKSMGMVEENG